MFCDDGDEDDDDCINYTRDGLGNHSAEDNKGDYYDDNDDNDDEGER